MGVLVTRKKAKALDSVQRDRNLLSDNAARDRILEAEPERLHKPLRKVGESRGYLEMRMKAGK